MYVACCWLARALSHVYIEGLIGPLSGTSQCRGVDEIVTNGWFGTVTSQRRPEHGSTSWLRVLGGPKSGSISSSMYVSSSVVALTTSRMIQSEEDRWSCPLSVKTLDPVSLPFHGMMVWAFVRSFHLSLVRQRHASNGPYVDASRLLVI